MGVTEHVPEWIEKLWYAWNVRVMILLSLALEIILIILGSRRRYFTGLTGLWIRGIVCTAYIMADWVAIVSISKLSDIATEEEYFHDNGLMLRVLWAPLLLVQLGGPDTITAYSKIDVHYWWSVHALKLAGPVVAVIYILVRRWTGSWLSILTLFMFVAGITKYGERLWALKSANRELPQTVLYPSWRNEIPDLQFLHEGYYWFQRCQPHTSNSIYGNLLVKSDDEEVTPEIYCTQDENALKVIEFELGFMYDMLYTKASILCSRTGCIVRFISFFCTVSVLLGFSIITKTEFSKIDVIITYVLLVGAVVLDIHALTLLPYSDWAIIWLISKHHEKPHVPPIVRTLAPLSLNKWKKRWSNSMIQFNLLSFCLYKEDKPTLFSRIRKVFRMDEKFKEYRCQNHGYITKKLRELMVKQVSNIAGQFPYLQPFNSRGEWTIKLYGVDDELRQTVQLDFARSIITWHIATDICYYLESDPKNRSETETTKLLSDYMMYLLVKRPKMLSIATQRFMFKSTCDYINGKFKDKEFPLKARVQPLLVALQEISSSTVEAQTCSNLLKEIFSQAVEAQACKTLLLEQLQEEQKLPWERSATKPPLTDACKIANTLMENPDRWHIISGVWMEMMCYAATHCPVDRHAEELRRGGELLTHVWLLLTNFGLMRQRDRTATNGIGLMRQRE